MDNMNLTSPEDWVDYQEGYLAIKDHKGEPARCLLSKYKSYQMGGIYILTDELIDAAKNGHILFDLEL